MHVGPRLIDSKHSLTHFILQLKYLQRLPVATKYIWIFQAAIH